MVILDCVQGTTDWLIERLWRLTASEAKTNITSEGDLSRSKAAIGAIDKLIAGIECASEMQHRREFIDQLDDRDLKKFIAHYTGEKFNGNLHTERGKDLEADASALLSEEIGIQLMDVGMCVMGDNAKTGLVSCSPDGLGYNSQNVLITGAELKNPCLAKFNGIVADRVLPKDYKLQVHFSMAVCELESWHFGAHFPGKRVFPLEVKREKFTDKVAKSLREFADLYRERYFRVMEGYEALEKPKPKAAKAKLKQEAASLI